MIGPNITRWKLVLLGALSALLVAVLLLGGLSQRTSPRGLAPNRDVLDAGALAGSLPSPIAPVLDGAGERAERSRRESDAIHGVVLMGHEPVYDAVVAYRLVGHWGEPGDAQYTSTNRAGTFSIATERWGRYRLEVSRAGTNPVVLEAAPGDTVTVELQRRDARGIIEGRVVDVASGLPVPEFGLQFGLRKIRGWEMETPREIASPSGEFREFVSLPGDVNEIVVSISSNEFIASTVGRQNIPRAARVVLGDIGLGRFGGCRGGTVIDEQSRVPIPGANVVLLSAGERQEAPTTTDSDGRFQVQRLAGARVVGMAVTAQGFAPVYKTIDDSELDVDMLVTIPMATGADIYGTVISATGEIPRNFQIGYWTQDAAGNLPTMPRLISAAVAPLANGEYRLSNVPTKPVLVGIMVRNPLGPRSGVRFQDLQTVQCTQGERRTLDFVVGEHYRVKLKPVAHRGPSNALVVASILGADSVPVGIVESKLAGEFEFENVRTGHYTLRIATSRQRFEERPLHVTENCDLGDVDLSPLFVR